MNSITIPKDESASELTETPWNEIIAYQKEVSKWQLKFEQEWEEIWKRYECDK